MLLDEEDAWITEHMVVIKRVKEECQRQWEEEVAERQCRVEEEEM